MKVLHVCRWNDRSGAGRAAYRIHAALRKPDVDSRFLAAVKYGDDESVIRAGGEWRKFSSLVFRAASRAVLRFQKTQNQILHSLSLFPSGLHQVINRSDADLVNLHWVCGEMISISEIGRISKPVVWTLHDSWAFCGAEHHPGVTDPGRFREGYRRDNRPQGYSGLDLDRWVWRRKMRSWKELRFNIICPSRWMAQCAGASVLMRDSDVRVVPNPIDTERWKPTERDAARQSLGLKRESSLVLFGALNGFSKPHKGFDLLLAAFRHLHGQIQNLELVVLGEGRHDLQPDFGFPAHYLGQLDDETRIRNLYNAVDLMVIPSRQDNLPNTGVEAHACGVPAVAFDACGLPDIVDHKVTGYLARPFDTGDLANGIRWVLEDEDRHTALRAAARARAERLWSEPVVAGQYLELYSKALKRAE